MTKHAQPAFATYHEWLGRKSGPLPEHFKTNAKTSIVKQGGDWDHVAVSMHMHKTDDDGVKDFIAFASAPIFSVHK